MVKINEQNEPLSSVECHGLEHVYRADGTETMKEDALARLISLPTSLLEAHALHA